MDNDTTENKYKYVYYDEKMQVIYICRYTQSMANLGESLRELENICLENDIPEFVIRDILRRSKIKLSILKNVQVTKSKELRQIILNDFHLLPTSGHAGME
nr:unnamed protein product [Callosobruchus chinensis]